MNGVQKGFTLLEIMIVVAIIGILAAIAVPAYQKYTIRAQISEGIILASSAKTAIAESFQNYGQFPTTNSGAAPKGAGLAAPDTMSGNYVTSIAVGGVGGVTDSTITVTYGNKANPAITGKTIVLTATPAAKNSGGSILWACNSAGNIGTIAEEYLPANCR